MCTFSSHFSLSSCKTATKGPFNIKIVHFKHFLQCGWACQSISHFSASDQLQFYNCSWQGLELQLGLAHVLGTQESLAKKLPHITKPQFRWWNNGWV
jgi:hypothetical protein